MSRRRAPTPRATRETYLVRAEHLPHCGGAPEVGTLCGALWCEDAACAPACSPRHATRSARLRARASSAGTAPVPLCVLHWRQWCDERAWDARLSRCANERADEAHLSARNRSDVVRAFSNHDRPAMERWSMRLGLAHLEEHVFDDVASSEDHDALCPWSRGAASCSSDSARSAPPNRAFAHRWHDDAWIVPDSDADADDDADGEAAFASPASSSSEENSGTESTSVSRGNAVSPASVAVDDEDDWRVTVTEGLAFVYGDDTSPTCPGAARFPYGTQSSDEAH